MILGEALDPADAGRPIQWAEEKWGKIVGDDSDDDDDGFDDEKHDKHITMMMIVSMMVILQALSNHFGLAASEADVEQQVGFRLGNLKSFS